MEPSPLLDPVLVLVLVPVLERKLPPTGLRLKFNLKAMYKPDAGRSSSVYYDRCLSVVRQKKHRMRVVFYVVSRSFVGHTQTHEDLHEERG